MQITGKRFFGITVVVVAGALASCTAGVNDTGTEYGPNMYHSVPYEPLSQITDKQAGAWVSSLDNGVGEYYNSNPLNPNGMTMREPAPNSVKRSAKGYLPYRIPKDSIELAARTLVNPLDSSAAVVDQGKQLYIRFCSHCHGVNGLQPGLVGEKFGGVPPYNAITIKDKPEGHIFHVITHGIRRMGPHASQLSVDERWKIVRYVQILQKQ